MKIDVEMVFPFVLSQYCLRLNSIMVTVMVCDSTEEGDRGADTAAILENGLHRLTEALSKFTPLASEVTHLKQNLCALKKLAPLRILEPKIIPIQDKPGEIANIKLTKGLFFVEYEVAMNAVTLCTEILSGPPSHTTPH